MTAIGLLGGTFDPVHNAHLALAEAAIKQYDLLKVVFIPTGSPVRKIYNTIASAKDRMAMLQLACANNPAFEVSSVEVDRPGVTYTIDTLRYFTELFGAETELYFIAGKDTTMDLPTWKQALEISKLVTILSANRISGQATDFAANKDLSDFRIENLDAPELRISSSQIRESLKTGQLISDLVPMAVENYIREHDLYG
jgi:nicotinate-nucleotide adenylyltransferase